MADLDKLRNKMSHHTFDAVKLIQNKAVERVLAGKARESQSGATGPWLMLQAHNKWTTSFYPCSHKPSFLCVITPDIFQF